MLKAILIDVGGPLVDEDDFYRMSDRLVLEFLRERDYDISKEEYQKVLQRVIKRCLPSPRVATLWYFIRPDVARFSKLRQAFRAAQQEWFTDWEGRKIRSGAEEAVARLATRYRLALAGNQLAKVKEFLPEGGILQHFQFSLVSEEMRVSKPDPLFFQIILDSLEVKSQEAVMIGDRLDYDIYPAKLLGMKAVRVLVGPYAMQEPQTPFHEPDITITSMAELPEAMGQLDRDQGGTV